MANKNSWKRSLVDPTIDVDIKYIVDFFNTVPIEVIREVNKDIPSIMKTTKSIVKSKMRKGTGVRKGIYKKSLRYKDLAEHNEEVHFIVGASKPHYRLTHLLEKGHRLVRTIDGVKTVIGKTKKIPHIKPGQDHADRLVIRLYDDAVSKALRRNVKTKKGTK